jgi:chromosome partitioning protein
MAGRPVENITISFLNQKGGVGKSSTVFHLAGYLASAGFSVLLIDADPQGSLGNGYFGAATIENLTSTETLAAIFDDANIAPEPASLCVPTMLENVGLVRANHQLARHNTPEPEQTGVKQLAIRGFLDELLETLAFDFVLIDCPPNLYQCSWNALVASDFVIIPVPPEDFGAQGLRVVHQAIEQARVLNPSLSLLGHLITRMDRRLILHQTYERKLRKQYGKTVFASIFPEANDFKLALSSRLPVTQRLPKSRASQKMSVIGLELLSRIHSSVNKQQKVA